MPEGLEAHQVRAIFFPKRKQFTFHRINMEYLVPLKSMRRDSIFTLLDTGLRNNLRNVGGTDDVLLSLRPQLEGVASRVSAQGAQLLRDREHLRHHLFEKTREGFPVYRAEVEADFASRKLSESLADKQQSTYHHVLTAEHMLKDALSVRPDNYRAHFELGWIYLFLLNALPESELHLEYAARYALEQGDVRFAIFARRHLADACYSQQKFGDAADHALQVLQTRQPEQDMEQLYECARYLAASGETRVATHRLAALVAQSPVYYVQAQVEPDFIRHDGIKTMLHDLRQVKVKRIQHFVDITWKNHRLAQMPLPDSIDPQQLFQQTFHQHVRVMAHLPYVTLSQREQQIGQLVVQASEQRILKEIRQRSRSYEMASDKKRQRWHWINQAGGFLMHMSVVLLLGCVLFYAARHLGGLLGAGSLLGSNAIVKQVLYAAALSFLLGLPLIRFIPWGVKRLLRKQVELDNTIKLLQAR